MTQVRFTRQINLQGGTSAQIVDKTEKVFVQLDRGNFKTVFERHMASDGILGRGTLLWRNKTKN